MSRVMSGSEHHFVDGDDSRGRDSAVWSMDQRSHLLLLSYRLVEGRAKPRDLFHSMLWIHETWDEYPVSRSDQPTNPLTMDVKHPSASAGNPLPKTKPTFCEESSRLPTPRTLIWERGKPTQDKTPLGEARGGEDGIPLRSQRSTAV
ncbi:hypothetical protein CH63R_10042 [Colletotrichum higginsianum IMI 349063]|uniref:Uncharacterized protein n=1 Tax=Colletotrichum higginsianum (strain IMI 349063) TaxID=759273 RepID=A0A1B7Y1R9_COLHI|nr:uncharacterized protein CH63R_10042 [Colletotrichum higginsianum IMI 349063]OBR05922.1 hypothetical protein CH63R_10042 [Colletotrichum higginsianum IMI 349063]